PLDPRAEGTNNLIKQGATCTTSAADVISVLQPILGRGSAMSLSEPKSPMPIDLPVDADIRDRVVALLGATPVALDDLIRLSGASASAVRMTLLELDVAGRLDRQPDGQIALR